MCTSLISYSDDAHFLRSLQAQGEGGSGSPHLLSMVRSESSRSVRSPKTVPGSVRSSSSKNRASSVNTGFDKGIFQSILLCSALICFTIWHGMVWHEQAQLKVPQRIDPIDPSHSCPVSIPSTTPLLNTQYLYPYHTALHCIGL